MCSAHKEHRRAGRAFARTFRGISPERAHTVEAVCAPFSFEAAPVLQTGLLLTVPVRSNCGCSVRDVYYPGGLPIRCLSSRPFLLAPRLRRALTFFCRGCTATACSGAELAAALPHAAGLHSVLPSSKSQAQAIAVRSAA